MSEKSRDDLDELETPDEDEDLEEDFDEDAVVDVEDVEDEPEEAVEEEPVDEALVPARPTRRPAAAVVIDEEPDEDALTLVSDDEPILETLPVRVAPIKEQKEFVCKRCFLVKARSQLADPERGLCRDCV